MLGFGSAGLGITNLLAQFIQDKGVPPDEARKRFYAIDRDGLITDKTQGLLDADALLSVLTPRKQVKAYLHGHTHCWDYQPMQGIHVVTLPTLVWVFDKLQPRGWVDAKLRPDGMTLKLCAVDLAYPANGQVRELKWR